MPFVLPLFLLLSPNVSVRSLLPEMVDYDLAARRPSPYFVEAQASSYDRASKVPGGPNWFANGDNGQYIRTEQVGDHKEHVMAALKGPGAVVRIWSANPSGTFRFYFDGETEPRLKVRAADLLTGKYEPLTDPFAYTASQGTDLYFPFPYEKSLKITVDDSDNDAASHLYYHVGYRTYDPGTPVQTFTQDDLSSNGDVMRRVGQELTGGVPLPADASVDSARATLQPGRTFLRSVGAMGGGEVVDFQVRIPFPLVESVRALSWTDPHQPNNVLRNLLLSISFDGQRCVLCPLGDFFGSAPGLNVYRTFVESVSADGTLDCRLVMPFARKAEFRIVNTGAATVPVQMRISSIRKPFDENTYYLHAQWTGEHARTRPMRDMNFVTVQGEGVFVGDNLTVSNPVPGWWGEGDEKVYVDGESFPSTFGTGTEDYFGYAWSSNQPFMRPYHAQPRCDGPGNMGHSSVMRWQLFDRMPFRSSFRFDLEMWHWADVVATYVHTAYWYARPGTTPPAPIARDLLAPMLIEPPKPVAGAIEGESLKVLGSTGGKVQIQGGFGELSGEKQLWWTDPAVGSKLVLLVPVPKAGKYEVVGNFCHAHDYGIHRILVNGKSARTIDFYSADLGWKKTSLGVFNLPRGAVKIEVDCLGSNRAAAPARMFGLDYLLLNRK